MVHAVLRATLLALLLASASTPAAGAASELAYAARTVMALDRTPTLVTLDAEGRPRARTIQVSAPDESFVLWIATKPNTRKVEQLRGDARVTLH